MCETRAAKGPPLPDRQGDRNDRNRPPPRTRGDASPEPPPPDEAQDTPGEPEAESGCDGNEDEFHYGGETYVGSQDTPEFRAWDEQQKRRKEPPSPAASKPPAGAEHDKT